MFNEPISPRHLLHAAALASATACAPALPLPGRAPQTTGDGWHEWSRTLERAKQEGTLTLVTTLGSTFRDGVREFEKAFPGLTVDHVQLNASAFAPRVLQERKGGLYSFDAVTSNYGTFGLTLIPSGVCDPIREAFLN